MANILDDICVNGPVLSPEMAKPNGADALGIALKSRKTHSNRSHSRHFRGLTTY